MKRSGIVTLVFGLSFFVFATPGQACTCGPDFPPPVLEHHDSMDAVFTGIVMNVTPYEASPGLYDVEFSVTGVWKGVSTSVVHVLTPMTDGACGIAFYLFVGSEFLVYADADWYSPSGPLATHLCTRTIGVEHAQEDFEILGSPYSVPVEESRWGAIKALYE